MNNLLDEVESVKDKRLINVKKTSRVITGISVVVGTTAITLSGVIKFIKPKSTALVNQFDVTSNETSVFYQVKVTTEANKKLYIRLHNYFTDWNKEITANEATSGAFNDLEKYMSYTVTLYEDNTAIQSQKIITYNDEEEKS